MNLTPPSALPRAVGSAAVLSMICLSVAAAQAWSTTGPTGTVDEDSLDAVDLNRAVATFAVGTIFPSTLTLRFPIQNQWSGEPAPNRIGARFIDSGSDTQVVLMLKKLHHPVSYTHLTLPTILLV